MARNFRIGTLGGLNLYSWVFSSFLLSQTAMTVVFGKAADIYGRKPVMLAGIAIFLAGSVLCSLAWSMPSMILFRLIQGAGAGAVQPVAMTIVADHYPGSERGKVQGYLASVWAVSAVLGPLVGALIIQHLSWPWIFWINVPIGLAAAAGFNVFLHEGVRRKHPPIDIAGALLFTIAIASLLIGLTESAASNDRATLVAALLFCVSSILFVTQERRARDPIISFGLWSRRPIAASNIATVLASMALMGLTTFLPMYVQGVLHGTPLAAGLALTMMLFGWPAAATLGAKNFKRFGLRPILVAGSMLLPVGAAVFVFLTPESSPVSAAIGSLIMGFGMGLLSVTSLVLIQEIVQWSERGAVTASNLFSRNLGSTLGATVLGAVLNYRLSHSAGIGTVTSDKLRSLLEAPSSAGNEAIRFALQQSLNLTFWAMLAISFGIVLAAFLVPPVAIRQAPEVAAE